MDFEQESLNMPKAGLSLEELEKKYFKNNQNYYTTKKPETTFDKFEISERDLQILRSHVGDEEIAQEPVADEPISDVRPENNVDMMQIRPSIQDQLYKQIYTSFSAIKSLSYMFLAINISIFLITMYTFVVFRGSLVLIVCLTSHMTLLWRVSATPIANSELAQLAVSVRGLIQSTDLFILLWPPIRQILIALVAPHQDWSPLTPASNDNFSILITLLLIAKHLILRRLAKLLSQANNVPN